MLVDLVKVQTRDGLRLDGMFRSPETPSSLRADAFCLIHGTGGNFYSSTLFDDIGDRLLAQGCAVLRINTRGHDGISTAQALPGGRRQGAAYEIVDDCRHDIAAWMQWLRERCGPSVGLIGHSSGALKALYAVANEPNLAPACVIALSPPRLSYSWYCTNPEAGEFLAAFAKAEELIQKGQPGTLIDIKLPLPFVITAAGFVEKYGPDERYNYLRFLRSVACPTLITFGEREVKNNLAFREAPQAVSKAAPNLDVRVVAEADHFYTGVRENLLAELQSWWNRGT